MTSSNSERMRDYGRHCWHTHSTSGWLSAGARGCKSCALWRATTLTLLSVGRTRPAIRSPAQPRRRPKIASCLAYRLRAEFQKTSFSKRRGPRFWQISDSAPLRTTFELLSSYSLLQLCSPTNLTNILCIHSYIPSIFSCDSRVQTAHSTPRKRVAHVSA